MTSKLEKELYRAAVLTFEEMGFMLPSDEVDARQQAAKAEATVTVPFDGPFSGRLTVTVCGGILGDLAANMLGEDAEVAQEHLDDALGEIGNVICGNILPRIAGTAGVFDLKPPYVLQHAGPEALSQADTPAATAHVGLDSGRADLALFVTNAAMIQAGEPAH